MTTEPPFVPTGPTAHVDTFVRDRLPPADLWPRLDFSRLPTLRAYPPRINACRSLLDTWVAAGHGPNPALVHGDTVWSYAELHDRVQRIARTLVDRLGVKPGNRVLIRGPNNPMTAACWLAVIRAGAVAVATMPLLRARELAHMVAKAEIQHALCDARLVDELERARDLDPRLATIGTYTPGGEGDASLDRALPGASGGFDPVDTAADDPALIAFTSGTTGQPKGTVHFHRDVVAMCDCFPPAVLDPKPTDVYIGTPPLAFTFGLGALLCFPLRRGASTVLVEKPDPQGLLETIARHRCTALFTAPTMYRAMLEHDPGQAVRSVRACVSAGEHLLRSTFDAWTAATGRNPVDGLGTTEMIHIFLSAPVGEIRPGTIGRAIPGYDVTVLDETGQVAAPDQAGQLAVRGPTGCRYLDDEERQLKYVRDGWNLPGDVCIRDADGYIRYQARADDMIVSSGYNISGPEVEDALLSHPAVRECAVVGVPDAARGNIVKAFVVLRDPSAASDALTQSLQAHVKEEIAPYKYPRAVEFIADLPRTKTGKVQRFKLRDAPQAQRTP